MSEMILQHPDPFLKKHCDKVPELDEAVRLGRELLDIMFNVDPPGIGLAAPQIGINARVIVMDCDLLGIEEDGVFIDPRIIDSRQTNDDSRATDVAEEGCLSVDHGQTKVRIRRPKKIRISYTNSEGERIRLRLSGLAARCASHEIDHLNGRLILDHGKRLSPEEKLLRGIFEEA